MTDRAEPQASEDPTFVGQFGLTRDVGRAAERLHVPASAQAGTFAGEPFLQELPHWVRAMGCEHYGVPFHAAALNTMCTVRLSGVLACQMLYSNPAVLAEADRLHLNDRRVLRIRKRVFNADTRTYHLLSTKFVTANGKMRVPSHALWMRIFNGAHFKTSELRRGQNHPVLQAANPVSAIGACPPLRFDHEAQNFMLGSLVPAAPEPAPAAAPEDMLVDGHDILHATGRALQDAGLHTEQQRNAARDRLVAAVIHGQDPIDAARAVLGQRGADVIQRALNNPRELLEAMGETAGVMLAAVGPPSAAGGATGPWPRGAGAHDLVMAHQARRVCSPILNQAVAPDDAYNYGGHAGPWSTPCARMMARTVGRMWARRSDSSRSIYPHAHPIVLCAIAFVLRDALKARWNPGTAVVEGQPEGGEAHAEQLFEFLLPISCRLFEHWAQVSSEEDMAAFQSNLALIMQLGDPDSTARETIPRHVVNVRQFVCDGLGSIVVDAPPPGRAPVTGPNAPIEARLREMMGTVRRLHEHHRQSHGGEPQAVTDDGFPIYYIGEDGVPQLGRAPDVAPDVTLDSPTDFELAQLQNEADEDKKDASGGASAAKVCVVCMDNPVRVVFTGCGHATCCAVCVNKLERKCPTCRKVSKPIRMYT